MEAVIFLGLRGSGKSTFYRDRFADTHLRLSLDMLRTRHRERILLAACVEGKQRFVVDNTNPTTAERQVYIRVARGAGFRVVGCYPRCGTMTKICPSEEAYSASLWTLIEKTGEYRGQVA